jgi:hypothetical protein
VRDIGKRLFALSHDCSVFHNLRPLFCADQMPEVVARTGHLDQVVQRCMLADAATLDKDKPFGDFSQQIELPSLVRVQADEQQAVAPPQLIEKPQHEPDVTVLVQLRSSNRCTSASSRVRQQHPASTTGSGDLIRLVIMPRKLPRSLRRADVLPAT